VAGAAPGHTPGMTLGTLLAAAALLGAAGPALAGDDPDAPFPIELRVGETVDLCATGTLVCPAGAARCDDLGVARPEAGPKGLLLRAVAVGETLCSAGSAAGAGGRQVYRVKVVAASR